MSATATATRPGPETGTSGKRPRRRRLRVILISVALVLVLAGVGWLGLFSSVLAAHQVRVTGTRELSVAQVQDATAVPMGRPLLRLDLDALARRTTSLPKVASARVSRSWPDTVRIEVVERRPLLAVAQPDGFLIIDKTGFGYETRSKVPDGVLTAEVNPDNMPLLQEVGVAAAALPKGLKSQVRRISASSTDTITLTLDSGVIVTWGDAEQSPLKAKVTTALLKQDPKTSIDVSSPHNPAYR